MIPLRSEAELPFLRARCTARTGRASAAARCARASRRSRASERSGHLRCERHVEPHSSGGKRHLRASARPQPPPQPRPQPAPPPPPPFSSADTLRARGRLRPGPRCRRFYCCWAEPDLHGVWASVRSPRPLPRGLPPTAAGPVRTPRSPWSNSRPQTRWSPGKSVGNTFAFRQS